MRRRAVFNNKVLPYVLLTPQLLITLVFFFWPAGLAIYQSFLLQDAFGLRQNFVWFDNFRALIMDPLYLDSAGRTVVFTISVTALSMSLGLLFAAMADRRIRGATAYKTLLIWPYAVAPAVAAVLLLFIFLPSIGLLGRALVRMGVPWDYRLNGPQAMLLVVVASAWKQVSYNFLFFLAGLQSIQKPVIEAAAIDGAGPVRRFWSIMFPLLSPTTFFLLVVNIVYAFFDTFGVIDATTQGGPAQATQILVYKVYHDAFKSQDLGGSSAQSVVLMFIVIALTVAQFRFVERKVQY
jgi:sn-glycerol 3-phosphate transport system permease protein